MVCGARAGRGRKEKGFWKKIIFGRVPRLRGFAPTRSGQPETAESHKEKEKKKTWCVRGEKEALSLRESLRSDNLKSVHRMYSGSSDAPRSSDSGETERDLLHLGPGLDVVLFFFLLPLLLFFTSSSFFPRSSPSRGCCDPFSVCRVSVVLCAGCSFPVS